ncbi:myb-like protein X isoform X2 [Drosophila elegans]|uniref:myb-like protein X isoform X2 n=1 Tax=Drosophila elegans TaxID=30023 RepID=UPI0007E69BAA|nr:myb-like protein X isoform X2 [Drosophila elegans]
MMEVSQNVEMKDLSSEGPLRRTLSTDLGSNGEPLSTPAIVNKSSRKSRDEDDLCELTNGVGASDSVKEKERNAGSDLDALLDKISSIVDTVDKSEECDSESTKEKTADETEEKHAEYRKVSEAEVRESAENEDRVEPDSKEKAKGKDIEDIEKPATAEGSTEETEDLAEATEESIGKEIDAEKKLQEKNVVKTHSVDNNEKVRAKVNSSSDDVFMDALDSISSSDEFDAFSSQDSKKPKQSNKLNAVDKPVANDLDEISSDDEDILKHEKVENADESGKPKADIIDLDSSDECVVCETPAEEVAKIEDTVEVTQDIDAVKEKETEEETISDEHVDKADDEPIKANEEEEKLTEVGKEEPQSADNPTELTTEEDEESKVTEEFAEPMPIADDESLLVEEPEEESVEVKEAEETVEDKEAKEPEEVAETEKLEEVKDTEVLEEVKDTEELEEVKESEELEEIEDTVEPKKAKLSKETQEDKGREDRDKVQSTEEPKEPTVIADEEAKDPKKANKTEVALQTKRSANQQMNETTIGDLLMEVDEDILERAEKNANEDEPKAISKNKEPKVNGVCKKPTVDNGEDLDKEVPTVEKEAKESESDDEVIFFEPIDKTNKADASLQEGSKMSEKPEAKEDEIVLVSEDEDEEPQAKKLEKDLLQSSAKETTAKGLPSDSPAESAEAKDLLLDNSDNACDQFEKLKTHVKAKSTATEDGNSNSSNLLRPAEEVEESASKRVRLSTDEKMDPDLETELQAPQKTTIEEDDEKEIVKRSHDHLDNSPDREEEIPNKKLKTEDSDSNSSCDGTLQIDLDGLDDKAKVEQAASPKIEDVKELNLELKPEPEIKKDIKPLRLEFFKTFRRTFDTMTRDDLEELVLQKVVEGMLVKSEFADIRLQLDKCENTLATYRRKIAEVSKQFLDLETVHKRVLKDLETKNSHFTAPVRITRAVGLQVGIPFKAMKPTVSVPEQPHSAGSMLAPSGTPPKASTSPMRSPMRTRPPVPGPAFPPGSSSGPSSSTTPNPSPQPQQSRSTANVAQTPASSTNPMAPVRRGCLQKVTPQRPCPANVLPVPPVNNQTNVHRLQSSPPAGQRTMHASKHTGTTASVTASSATLAAKVAAMRNRNSGNSYVTQKQQQQQQQYQTSSWSWFRPRSQSR